MTAYDLRLSILDAACRARHLPESPERTTVLDHLRFAARTLLPLVQAEEDQQMRDHLRARDTDPAPPPFTPSGEERHARESEAAERDDVAHHWSRSHE